MESSKNMESSKETVALHWVWVGDSLPVNRLSSVAKNIKKLKNTVEKTKEITGAIWFLDTGSYEEDEVRKKFDLEKATKSYCNLEGEEIRNLIGIKVVDSIEIPIFQFAVSDSDTGESLEKWIIEILQATKNPATATNYIAIKIAFSDVVRLDVLDKHSGLYLDFDAELKENINFEELKKIPLGCHMKEGFYENDFIWLSPRIDKTRVINGKMANSYLLKEPFAEEKVVRAIVSWEDLEFNLRGGNSPTDLQANPSPLESLLRDIEAGLKDADVSKEDKDKAASHLKNNGVYDIKWEKLAELCAGWKEKKDGDENKELKARREMAEKFSKTKIGGEKIWNDIGFGNYQKFMKINNSLSINDFFTEDSCNKCFYSWRDPGSEELVKMFKLHGLI